MIIEQLVNDEVGAVILTPRKKKLNPEAKVGTIDVPNSKHFAYIRIAIKPAHISDENSLTAKLNVGEIWVIRKSELDHNRKFEDDNIKGSVVFINSSFLVGKLSKDSEQEFEEYAGKDGL